MFLVYRESLVNFWLKNIIKLCVVLFVWVRRRGARLCVIVIARFFFFFLINESVIPREVQFDNYWMRWILWRAWTTEVIKFLDFFFLLLLYNCNANYLHPFTLGEKTLWFPLTAINAFHNTVYKRKATQFFSYTFYPLSIYFLRSLYFFFSFQILLFYFFFSLIILLMIQSSYCLKLFSSVPLSNRILYFFSILPQKVDTVPWQHCFSCSSFYTLQAHS